MLGGFRAWKECLVMSGVNPVMTQPLGCEILGEEPASPCNTVPGPIFAVRDPYGIEANLERPETKDG